VAIFVQAVVASIRLKNEKLQAQWRETRL